MLDAANVNLGERVATLETKNIDMEANNDIDRQINAGKIIPAQKDAFISLYKTSKESYDSIMANQPTIVNTGEIGASPGKTDVDGTMSAAQVKEKTDEYVGMISGKNGKKKEA